MKKKNKGKTFMEIADSVEVIDDESASKSLRVLRDVIIEKKIIESMHDQSIKERYAEHKKAKAALNNDIENYVIAESTLRDKVNDWLTEQGELAEEAAMRGECVSSLIPEDVPYAIADGYFDVQIESHEEFIRWAVEKERFDLLKIETGKLKKLANDNGGTLVPKGTTVSKRYRVKIKS